VIPDEARTLRTARQRQEAPRARLDRLIAFMDTQAKYREMPWGAVLNGLTDGLDNGGAATAVVGALTLLETWGKRPATERQLLVNHLLPPLEHRTLWASIELALVMLQRFEQAEERRVETTPTGADPAA
jgi:hypothetical protein